MGVEPPPTGTIRGHPAAGRLTGRPRSDGGARGRDGPEWGSWVAGNFLDGAGSDTLVLEGLDGVVAGGRVRSVNP